MNKINYLELENLVNSLKYGHGNILSKNNYHVITKPLNTWDTNYRLYDLKEEITYLIDSKDICNNEFELEEYGGILYADLLELSIENIKGIAWKTEKSNFY